MTYKETIDFLFSQFPAYQQIGSKAYKEGLDNTIALDKYFGHPHRKFKTIHVAGTNGKGSVSHTTASILQHAGFKVGLYTSPHLKDFRERIRINGQMIPETEVISFVEQNMAEIKKIEASFFEITTLMAFDWFARSGVDVAVIEVGLGGRLDSTNIITPIVSIITNISFDHTAMLGNTLAAIAAEKAGIIKNDVPAVIGQTDAETEQVFCTKADSVGTSIVFADQIRKIESVEYSADRQYVTIRKKNITEFSHLQLDLLGIYQQKNILTVLAAFDFIKNHFTVTKQNIEDGVASVISSTGLKGRWQKIGENPKIVCDTGHNDDGIRQIVSQLKLQKYNKLHIIIGMVSDKDHDKVLSQLPTNAIYYFTNAQIQRALPAKQLEKKAAVFGLHGLCYHDIPSAINAARKNASANDFIFIGGSTFTVAEIPDDLLNAT